MDLRKSFIKEDPVDESPLSIFTGDRGAIMGESGRDFLNSFSSTSMLSPESSEILLMVARSGRDWVCAICIRRAELAGRGVQPLSSF
jgi:hypothetical protein